VGPFYRYETGCAAHVLGCATCAKCAVVDPREEDVHGHAERTLSAQRAAAVEFLPSPARRCERERDGPLGDARLGESSEPVLRGGAACMVIIPVATHSSA
jgi:hypothetical protein